MHVRQGVHRSTSLARNELNSSQLLHLVKARTCTAGADASRRYSRAPFSPGAQLAVLGLLTAVLERSTDGYESLQPLLVRSLAQTMTGHGIRKDYLYYGIPSPWLQCKCANALCAGGFDVASRTLALDVHDLECRLTPECSERTVLCPPASAPGEVGKALKQCVQYASLTSRSMHHDVPVPQQGVAGCCAP